MDGSEVVQRPFPREASREPVPPALGDLDPTTRFLYTPHTVTGLVAGQRSVASSLIRRGKQGFCSPAEGCVRRSAGVVVLIYFSRALNPPVQAIAPAEAQHIAYSHVKHGITAACLVFLGAYPGPYGGCQCMSDAHEVKVKGLSSWCTAGYSFLQGPSTCMVRPHPGFWRVIHGVVILYLLALVFLLFQNVDDARQLLKVCGAESQQQDLE